MHPEILNKDQQKIFPKLFFLTREKLYLAGGTAVKYQGINFVSVDDIAAMKLIAISRRGRKRDYIDLKKILTNTRRDKIPLTKYCNILQ